MKSRTFRIDDDEDERIERAAREFERDASKQIRHYIRQGLERDGIAKRKRLPGDDD